MGRGIDISINIKKNPKPVTLLHKSYTHFGRGGTWSCYCKECRDCGNTIGPFSVQKQITFIYPYWYRLQLYNYFDTFWLFKLHYNFFQVERKAGRRDWNDMSVPGRNGLYYKSRFIYITNQLKYFIRMKLLIVVYCNTRWVCTLLMQYADWNQI